jgi:hypothetical protein
LKLPGGFVEQKFQKLSGRTATAFKLWRMSRRPAPFFQLIAHLHAGEQMFRLLLNDPADAGTAKDQRVGAR